MMRRRSTSVGAGVLALLLALATLLASTAQSAERADTTRSAASATAASTAASAAGAATDTITSTSPLGTAERVLVFSVPTLSWKDLQDHESPALDALLADSAIADLSVRSVARRVTATDGYATLNAGTRTRGTSLASLAFVAGLARFGSADQDGDPIDVPPGAFEQPAPDDELPNDVITAPESTVEDDVELVPDAGEEYAGSPASEEFARRTGVMPEVGQVFNFGLVSMRRVNSSLLFGARVGALGAALSEADVRRAVIANGDLGEGKDDLDFRREASVGLMDQRGLVDRGRVGRTLLRSDSAAPFGTRLDIDEVVDSFEEFWRPRSVVLVEASDLVREEAAKPLALDSQQRRLRAQAIAWSDELLARLLEQVDLARDAVVVVAPYAADESSSLTVLGVHAPAVESGLLSSGTTRRAGFVQGVDVGPTVLSLLGLATPPSMEGTPSERAREGGTYEQRRTFLIEADSAAAFRDRALGPASVLFVLAQIALWALALVALSRRRQRLRSITEVAALAVLFFLPYTYVAGAFPFHRWGAAAFWGFLLAASGATAWVVHAATRRNVVDPLIAALGAIVAFMSIDIVVGGPLQFNTVFGYTPTVAGRFQGMGNPAFSMTAAAGIILAALVAHRIGGRRGAWVATALLAWIVVLDGAPFLGADVGGALALVPSAAVTATLLLGIKVRLRSAILWGAATIVVVLGFGVVDLMRPPAQRTHLGRLLADIGDKGFEAFQTVVLRKLNANLSVLTSSIWTLMLPVVFASVAFLIWWAPWRLKSIEQRIPEQRAAVAGLLTAMVLGFVLNDSGISIPGMMLGVINASLVYLVVRIDEDLTDEERAVADRVEPAIGGVPPEPQPEGSQSART